MRRAELAGQIIDRVPRRLIDALSAVKARIRNGRAKRRYRPAVAMIVPAADRSELLVANDDAVVYRVATSNQPDLILKLATTPVADELLGEEARALDELCALDELGPWRSKVAVVCERGTHKDGTWFTQTTIPGSAMSAGGVSLNQQVDAALSALEPLHRATAITAVCNDDVLNKLVHEPAAKIRVWRPALGDRIDVLVARLTDALAGNELQLSRTHGDYAPSNVLWDSATDSVTGIVDWTFSPALLVPEVDYVQFALSAVMTASSSEYGVVISRMLAGTAADLEQDLIRRAIAAGPNSLDPTTAIALAWLHHAAFTYDKAQLLRSNPIWVRNNLDLAIEALTRSG